MNEKLDVIIRQENKGDHKMVFQLIEKAFQSEQMSDHTEQFLVQRLRKSRAFIPELSLVACLPLSSRQAEMNGKIVGHILLTKLKIKTSDQVFDSLALAPVSVLPEYQGKGIGRSLILAAHEIAKSLNYQSIVLIGHKDYYPKLGYRQAREFGIELPYEVPKEYCMAIELIENGLQTVSGMVEYPDEFNPD